MIMKPNKWMRWMIAISIMAMMTTGCSLGGNDKSQPIDPPPGDTGTETDAADPTAADLIDNPMNVTMYFEDANGFVAPITMTFPAAEEVGKLALRHMVKGGPGESMLPDGFGALLPEGTEVLGMSIVDRLAIVDLSEEFANYDAADERKIMEAVTWTLTGFPTIDRVELRIQGETLKEMPVAGTPMDQALTRAIGINLEREAGVQLAQATPVTVYFKGTASDSASYLVPVTRLIGRTDNVLQAALSELAEGPQSSGLAEVMLPGTEALAVEVDGHVVNVNFNDAIANADQTLSDATIQSVVMSLLDNSEATHVRLMVEGSLQATSESGEAILEPVARPNDLNKIEL